MPNGEHNGTKSPDTLHGWKDIATYLNRSVRAVQRWEHELGLPVHRIRATDGHTVYAFQAEVDAWRKSRDLPKAEPEDNDIEGAGPLVPAESRAVPAWRRPWLLVALAAVLLVTLGAAWGAFLVATGAGPMASIRVAGTSVVAYDSFGRVAWTHSWGRLVSDPAGFNLRDDRGAMFVDLDRDGQSEAIVGLRFATDGTPSRETDALMAYDAQGNVRWKVQPDWRLQCGAETFEGPWRIYAVRASADPGPQRVWVAFNHSTWWPGFVMEVSATGNPRFRMLNTGWIADIAEWRTPSGEFLAVAGFNNEHVRPVVSLIDLDGAAAMSPHAEPRFSCAAAPDARPRSVYLLPVMDTTIPANVFASLLTVLASDLKVGIRNGYGDTVARIGANLTVTDFSLADNYWAAHREREADGLLHHPAEACPEPTKKHPVETWTAATGWRSSTIVPTVRQSPARK